MSYQDEPSFINFIWNQRESLVNLIESDNIQIAGLEDDERHFLHMIDFFLDSGDKEQAELMKEALQSTRDLQSNHRMNRELNKKKLSAILLVASIPKIADGLKRIDDTNGLIGDSWGQDDE